MATVETAVSVPAEIAQTLAGQGVFAGLFLAVPDADGDTYAGSAESHYEIGHIACADQADKCGYSLAGAAFLASPVLAGDQWLCVFCNAEMAGPRDENGPCWFQPRPESE